MVPHQYLVHAATSAGRPTMLRTCCLILCLVAGSRQLNITDIVVPYAVESGSSAELQCRFSVDTNDEWSYVKWWWTPMYGSEDEKIPNLLYQRVSGRDPDVSKSNIEIVGNDTIIINNMQFMDSGKYECEVSGDTEVRVHRELVVFSKGSGPMLNMTSTADGPDEDDDDDVSLECEAYSVTPQPDLVIFIYTSPVETTEEITNITEGLFNVRVNATVSKQEVIGRQIRCELFYVNNEIIHQPYSDSKKYLPGAELSTTEAVEDTTQLGDTSESLQNQTDASIPVYDSWLLVAAMVPIHFYNLV